MSFPGPTDLVALEEAIDRAVERSDPSALEVVGYGEVSIALKLTTPSGTFACKRLVPFPSSGVAEDTASVIHSYIAQLRDCGIDVIETETPVIERESGHVVYCVQPMVDPKTLGPEFLRDLPVGEAVSHVERIFKKIHASVSPTLAPDGQLSNWAFVDHRLLYLDVGTPFLRDEKGSELFDFGQQTRALPYPIRIIVDRFFIKNILDNYHSVRGQALDFLGNLVKEGLGHLISELIPRADGIFNLVPELTEDDVQNHYRGDAQTFELIQAARRADRWVHLHVLRKPYPYILPPRIARFTS